MTKEIRNRAIVSVAWLLATLLGIGASAEEAFPWPEARGGMGDPVCEAETRDLGAWLYALAAAPDDQIRSEPLDVQLLDPVVQPLAERLSSECSPVGWALLRVGDADGRDKVLWLAEYLPTAVEQCGCELDMGALRYLLWQVCSSTDEAGSDGGGEDALLADREKEERSTSDLLQPEPHRRLDQGRRGRARWNPRNGGGGAGQTERFP